MEAVAVGQHPTVLDLVGRAPLVRLDAFRRPCRCIFVMPDKVRHVRCPRLPSHLRHELAACQMDDLGGLVSFELDGTEEDARAVLAATRIWRLGKSLGGVASLIEHRA